MRKPTRSPKKINFSFKEKPKHNFTGIQAKITFRCDIFLIEKIKNMLASQHLAGNYQYPNLSYFFRSALHAYQTGRLVLTYRRQDNPRKEITFCLTEDLFSFYNNSLPARSKTEILERVLGSFYQG
jgi:hypothetical protein